MTLDIDRLLSTKLLKADEVASILQIGRSTVYQMCKKRELPFVAIGHSVRIRADDLVKWLEERRSGENGVK